MRVIGERYQRQEYYLSGLILAGEIFSEVLATVQPELERELAGEASGIVLLGTVAGDIHDIGKNLMGTMLRSFGFTVHDLGIDVPPDDVRRGGGQNAPRHRRALRAHHGVLRQHEGDHRPAEGRAAAAPTPFVILGGGIVDEDVRLFAGADSWSADAMEGVRICQRVVAGRTSVGRRPTLEPSDLRRSSGIAGEQLRPEVPAG